MGSCQNASNLSTATSPAALLLKECFLWNLYGNFTLRMNHVDMCSHYKPRCRLHALYIWVVLYICAFESVTDTLFHLRGETMRLPLIQFSIFRVLSETVTETNTQQSLWQILSTVCVVCLQQRRRGNKKTDRCVFHFPESVSPASRYSSRDEFVPLCFSSFLNKLLLPHSLSFEFDRQTKDRMEQWVPHYRSALISNDWYFVAFLMAQTLKWRVYTLCSYCSLLIMHDAIFFP